MRSRLAWAILPLGIALVGCGSVPGPTAVASAPPAASSPSPSAALGSASPASSVPVSPSGGALDTPKIAAQHLLTTKAYDLELKILREQRATDPVETLVTGTGRMEPPTGRGHVRYDFTGL